MRVESNRYTSILDDTGSDCFQHGSVRPLEDPYFSSVSSLKDLNLSSDENESKIVVSAVEASSKVNSAWSWIRDKWNSFLVEIGVKKATPQTVEKSKSVAKAKIKDKEIIEEIEEEFQYIEVSQTDPLKAMIDILVRQGIIRQEEAHLLTQKLLQAQSCLKDIHKERMEYKAEIAVLNKKGKTIQKVNVGLTAAQVLGFILSGLSVVAYAATLATGGTAAPIAIVLNVANGIVGGAQAFNTYQKGSNKEAMDKLQSKMLSNNSKKDELQFIMKMDVKELKRALDAVTSYAEMGQMIIASQYGKNQ
jgi:hypothetical protein